MKAESTDTYHVVYNPRGAFEKEGDPNVFDIIPKSGKIDSKILVELFANNIHPIGSRRNQEKIGSYINKNPGMPGRITRLFDLIEE